MSAASPGTARRGVLPVAQPVAIDVVPMGQEAMAVVALAYGD